MEKEVSCKERINSHYKSRMSDIKILWANYNQDIDDPDFGRLSEYGLGFDYVEANTFNNQLKGYYRYQLGYGGPSDEFRFYVDHNGQINKIEYVFLDWFDGAKKNITGKALIFLKELYCEFLNPGIWHNHNPHYNYRGITC